MGPGRLHQPIWNAILDKSFFGVGIGVMIDND